MSNTSDTAKVNVVHIADDPLYQTEKPYAADFAGPQQRSNHIFETKSVEVKDARLMAGGLSLQQNGFCVVQCVCPDFLSKEPPESAVLSYYKYLESLVIGLYPEYSRVFVLEHQLRASSREQQQSEHEQQPAKLVHRDFTTRGMLLRMETSCPGQRSEYVNKDMDFLNIWQVLRGPNNDWPLGLCDYSTIDPETDTIPNDMLSSECIGENELLYARSTHQWYYVSDQDIGEAILFRNASTNPERSYAFHAAFDLQVPNAVPRRSVEFRMVAFRH